MSDDTPKKYCGNCGKITDKFWRRYKGTAFCAACYNREFKPQSCTKCGNTVRAHKNEPKPLCSDCNRSAPCVRCGKISERLGAITEYGNVCPSCRHYFKEPKACANCGKVTTRLSKSKNLGFDQPVCDQCFYSYRATCQSCGRHRILMKTNDDKHYCKPCLNQGEHNCKQCLQPMPAGFGAICLNCYYTNLFNKRVNTCLAGLSNSFYVELFLKFSAWLQNDVGMHKAAISINKHFPFFYFLNLNYPNAVPSYSELICHHGNVDTRTNSLPVRFCCESGRMSINQQEKSDAANHRVIAKLLATKTNISSFDSLLANYHRHLMSKLACGKTTIRSVRLALSPVISFMSSLVSMKNENINQDALNQYLKSSPGQCSAITGFVLFCKKHGLTIDMPNKTTLSQVNNRAEVERLLIQHIKKGDDLLTNIKFRIVALAYFHFMPPTMAKKIARDCNLSMTAKNCWYISYENVLYPIPQLGHKTHNLINKPSIRNRHV